jgi:hypothetical protein
MAPAFAQQPEQAAKPEEQAAQTPAKTEEKAASPAPSTEQWLTGSVDFGYRWLTDIRGSFPEYRSVVNLGEGPKLFGVDLSFQDPKKRMFDRLDVRAAGWGGDPYNTAHLDSRKLGIYDLSVDYRNIAYFNAVPSFANAFAPAGFNERSFDIYRRNASFQLDLFPGKRITPYLAFERNSGYGHGIETWVQGANNDFAVPYLMRDSTNTYRGGLRFESNRFHLTLEQGGTTFKDDDQTNWTGSNPGDRTALLLGQTSLLTSLKQAYGIRGNSVFSKVLLTASPTSRLNVFGQFLYSQPKTDVTYSELAGGNFAVVSALLLYGGQYGTGSGSAIQPHVSGNVGVEVRPWHRLRIIESLTTDRQHDSAFGLFNQLLLPALTGNTAPVDTTVSALSPKQIVKYNQAQTDVLFDVTSKLTLRGGHRYLRGDASVLAGNLSQSGPTVAGELHRNVALAGATVRASEKLSANFDYEVSSSDRVYFRTSLNEYHKVRARAKYQLFSSLMLQANFQVLNNQNPATDIRYDFQSRDNAVTLFWTPKSGKWISVMGEYDRSTLRSSIRYLDLPFLTPATSYYRENAHTATSAIDLVIPGARGGKLTAGGSLFVASGTRPTRFYQPLLRLSLPLHKQVSWNTEWQYYGFGEQFFLYEGFRTHAFTTGLKITR